ncbi:DUF3224 domain-containing protein [Nonomuraea mesophila]|nr:DUF3224 domain-containing protein [Nonomuraea mesophila]
MRFTGRPRPIPDGDSTRCSTRSAAETCCSARGWRCAPTTAHRASTRPPWPRSRSTESTGSCTEHFSGGIVGVGHADHVRVVQPDGSQIVTGVERIVGSVDGRSGSFVLTCYGFGQRPGSAQGYRTVLPGSGTGELAGLRGRGAFTVRLEPDGTWRAEDTFTHWFDP